MSKLMQNDKTDTARELNDLLADTYVLYNSTQQFHWNVTGPNFKQLHDMFEEQYTELASAIDDVAERIRTLGHYPSGALSGLVERSRLRQRAADIFDESEMLEELIGAHTSICNSIRSMVRTSEESGDEGTVDLLVERLRVHEKTAWMLESQAGRKGLRLTQEPSLATASALA